MPSNPTTSDMGRLHEEHAAEIFGGARSRGSGSTWKDQTDGYNGPDDPFSFRWDCKSTKAASISVSLATVEKVTEQAQGHRWAIPLRLYGNDKLTVVSADLVALKDTDVAELLEAARSWAALTEDLMADERFAAGAAKYPDLVSVIKGAVLMGLQAGSLRQSLADAHDELISAGQRIAAQELEIAARREAQDVPGAVAQWVPRLPWTVIHMVREEGAARHAAVRYREDHMQELLDVGQVRVERSVGNRPRLFMSDRIIRNGDLYLNGVLQVRACEDDPSIEVG